MTTDPSDTSRDDLESLLDGQGGDLPSPHLRRLADLLAAASAPGTPNELRGERGALAAFRAGRVHPLAAGRPPSRSARTTARIAAAVVAVSSLGATAVAMATGSAPHLPVPTPLSAPSQASASGSPATGGGREHVMPAPSAVTPLWTAASPDAASSATPSGGGASLSGSPSETAGSTSLTGVCRAYLAISESRRRQALKDPTFRPLVSPAGGRGKVDAYCEELLASQSGPPARSPTSSPAPSPELTPSPSRHG
jgi:hypothetical protein